MQGELNAIVGYDDLIFRLQRSGGITTVFNEIQSRLPKSHYLQLRSKYTPQIARIMPIDVSMNTCDIFHSTFYGEPDGRYSGGVVTTVHDFIHERYWSGFRRRFNRYLIGRAIRRAHRIITVSNFTKNELLRFYPEVDQSHVHVIHNAASECFLPRSVVWEQGRILYVGSRSGYKNFELAVQAVSAVRGYKLVIIGGGKLMPHHSDILECYLKGRFECIPYASRDELAHQYNRAQALLYPSRYEGFGIPILEAMQSGCPVVGLESPVLREVCDFVDCLVPEGTVKQISKALKNLEHIERRDELVKAGFERSRVFSWGESVRKTVGVYNQVHDDLKTA